MRRLQQFASSTLAAVFVLTALNVAICWPLFHIEYIDHFNSIEGSFIAISRFITRHWGDFSWFPLWHCGMPYQDTYVPLLHMVVAIAATLAKTSVAHAYHVVIAVAYALGPATLYLMAVRLGAHRGAAFLSALFYSLLSPSTFFLPDIARDVGGLWLDRRLQVLTTYGEGPHITAMTVAPLAILALESTLARRTGRPLALAALAIAAVLLTNVPGTGALALAVFCWICAQPAGRRAAAWIVAACAGLFAYGLACYGVPPSALSTVAGNVGSMHPGFAASFRYASLLLLVVLALVVGAGHLLSRTPLRLDVRFAILYFALVAIAVLTARPTFELLPQSLRMQTELEMGACLLLGSVAWAAYGLTPKWVRPVVWVLCLAPIGVQFDHYRSAAQDDIRNADLSKRSEYTTARWLDANLNGRRVYTMGSTAFWLNAFSETPQLVGCCLQGQSMPILTYVQYLINRGNKPEETRAVGPWLEALGVEALVVSGPQSTDVYKDIQQPERFAGMYPVLHQENGDTIYSVRRGPASLAHVVRPEDPVPAAPGRRMDFSEVVKYADAVSRSAANFEWVHSGAARIRANLRRDDLVSVQVPWFSGWKASVSGQPRSISADGLGFMAIRPECEGDCEITLVWTGRPDQTFAAAVTTLSLAAMLLLIYTNKPWLDGIMKRMIALTPHVYRSRVR